MYYHCEERQAQKEQNVQKQVKKAAIVQFLG